MPPNRQISFDLVNVVYEGYFSEFNFMHNVLDSLLLMKDDALVHRGATAIY